MNEAITKKSGTDYLTREGFNTSEKKIGHTIYMANFRFNGNTKWDMAAALVRLMEQDASATAETRLIVNAKA